MRSFNERFFFINIIVLIPKDVIFLFNIYKPKPKRAKYQKGIISPSNSSNFIALRVKY